MLASVLPLPSIIEGGRVNAPSPSFLPAALRRERRSTSSTADYPQ